jgi:hypothetical protein
MSVSGIGGPPVPGIDAAEDAVADAGTDADGSAPPGRKAVAGADAAKAIEQAVDSGDSKGALKAANAIAAQLLRPGLGSPQTVANPDPAAVQAFQAMLGALESDVKLSDFGAAVAAQERALLANSHGQRPKDWFGPQETFTLLVQRLGTDEQNRAFGAGASGVAPLYDGEIAAERVWDAIGNGDFKSATRAALAASGGLAVGGPRSLRLNPKPDPAQVQTFKAMLSRLEKEGSWLSSLSTAVRQEEHDESKGRTPPILHGQGPAEVLDMLVKKYGTDAQKTKWKSAGPPPGPAAARTVASLVAAGGTDMAKGIADAAIAAAGSLFVDFNAQASPRVALEDYADPLALANFRSFLDDIAANGNIDDVQEALAADGHGLEIMQALVSRFGTPHEIDVWSLGGEDPFDAAP